MTPPAGAARAAPAAAAREPGRLRVLQVVLSLRAGGTERLVIEIVKRLGAEVASAVLCLDDPGAWAGEVLAAGVPLEALGRRPGFRPSVGLAIASAARRFGADAIHCHQYTPFVYGQLAALVRRRLRVVFTEHGRLSDAPPSPKRRLANALFARLGGRFYAVSRDLRRHLLAEGFPAARVGVVYNGIQPGPVPALTQAGGATGLALRSASIAGREEGEGARQRTEPGKGHGFSPMPIRIRAGSDSGGSRVGQEEEPRLGTPQVERLAA